MTDGDSDRIGAMDRDGTFITPHQIFSILLWHLAGTRGTEVLSCAGIRDVGLPCGARGGFLARVLRGGAWSASDGSCTSWVRNCDQMGLTDVCLTMDSNGFRCVRRKSKQ